MASNRKLPFGYLMEVGEIAIHPLEAVIVQRIFQRYSSGESYKTLVEYLREQDVSYDCGKIWNKNMVARILENRKYIGEQGWPAIITVEMYEDVSQKRAGKITVAKKTEVQKVLRRLCVGNATPDVEQNVLRLLNKLIASPEKICLPQLPPADRCQIDVLQQDLSSELDQQPVNEESAKSLAMELAATRFSVIGDQAYETERLRRLFAQHVSMPELDAELLRSAVSAIYIRKDNVTIRLKNGQTIERSSTS